MKNFRRAKAYRRQDRLFLPDAVIQARRLISDFTELQIVHSPLLKNSDRILKQL